MDYKKGQSRRQSSQKMAKTSERLLRLPSAPAKGDAALQADFPSSASPKSTPSTLDMDTMMSISSVRRRIERDRWTVPRGGHIFVCLALPLLCLLALSASTSAAPATSSPKALFGRPLIVPNINPSFKPEPFSSRQIYGTVDLSLVSPAGPAKLTLNLFDNVDLIAVRDRIEFTSKVSYTWFGTIEDEELSSVVLTVTNGRLAGSVRTISKGTFSVFPASTSTLVISQLNQTALPPDSEPRLPPKSGLPRRKLEERDIYPIDTPVIDVLVVYTTAARLAVGGTANMVSRIQLAIDETNAAYQNSGVTQRVRLVYSYETDYVEVNMNADLDAVTKTNDGILDEVHGLRDTYGADLVSLWTVNTDYCGLAWMATDPAEDFTQYGFSTVSYSCATGYFSFGHEMGHNMGGQHDRANAGGSTGMFSYSYGYQDPDAAFRTIMAYNCPGGGCTRIQYFSNPRLTYSGKALGVDASNTGSSADIAQTFNLRGAIVAAFKPVIVPIQRATTTMFVPTQTRTATRTPTATATRTLTKTTTNLNVVVQPRTSTTTKANPCSPTNKGVPSPLVTGYTDLILAPTSSPVWTCKITGSTLPCARNGRLVLGKPNVIRPMKVQNRRFTRGFGVTGASSTISVALQGRCGNLRVSFGLDDASALTSRAVFAIVADGKTLFTSTARKRGDPIQSISLSMVNVKSLVLRTTGTGAGTGYAQWLEPILACGPRSPYLPTISLTPTGFNGISAEPGNTVAYTASARDANGVLLPQTSYLWQLSMVTCTATTCRAPQLVSSTTGKSNPSFKLPLLPARTCGWYQLQVQATDSCGRRNVVGTSVLVPSRATLCA